MQEPDKEFGELRVGGYLVAETLRRLDNRVANHKREDTREDKRVDERLADLEQKVGVKPEGAASVEERILALEAAQGQLDERLTRLEGSTQPLLAWFEATPESDPDLFPSMEQVIDERLSFHQLLPVAAETETAPAEPAAQPASEPAAEQSAEPTAPPAEPAAGAETTTKPADAPKGRKAGT